MRYRHAILLACTPLLGVISAVFLTVFVDGEAINPQGGGGPANIAGILSMFWALFGWLVTIPLGGLLAAGVWLRSR